MHGSQGAVLGGWFPRLIHAHQNPDREIGSRALYLRCPRCPPAAAACTLHVLLWSRIIAWVGPYDDGFSRHAGAALNDAVIAGRFDDDDTSSVLTARASRSAQAGGTAAERRCRPAQIDLYKDFESSARTQSFSPVIEMAKRSAEVASMLCH